MYHSVPREARRELWSQYFLSTFMLVLEIELRPSNLYHWCPHLLNRIAYQPYHTQQDLWLNLELIDLASMAEHRAPGTSLSLLPCTGCAGAHHCTWLYLRSLCLHGRHFPS